MKNIKFVLIALSVLSLFNSCINNTKDNKETYTIQGKIVGALKGEVFIKVHQETGWESIDSATIVSGAFMITGQVDQAKFGYLTSDAFKGGIPMFIENNTINVSINVDSIQNAEVKGLESQRVYNDSKTKMSTFDKTWQDFYYNTYRFMTDEEKAQNEDYLNHIYDSAQTVKKQFLITYLKENRQNIASAQIILDQEDALGIDDMIKTFEGLDPLALKSSSGEQLIKRIEILKNTVVGKPLIDFVMNDTSGVAIKLSEATQGKYVLVDFWAAWCSPCRKENPNVLANYLKYHDKGFDVIGVSFDEKKDNWLKAIADDGLLWTQVSDLKGWNNAAGKLYGIRSIPQNILLDSEGIIIGKNLRGEELGDKLNEIFGE